MKADIITMHLSPTLKQNNGLAKQDNTKKADVCDYYIKIVAKYCAEEKTHEEICDLFKYAVELWDSNKHYQAIANMQVAKSRFEKEKSYDDVADCDFYLNRWFAFLDLNPKTSM